MVSMENVYACEPWPARRVGQRTVSVRQSGHMHVKLAPLLALRDDGRDCSVVSCGSCGVVYMSPF